MAVDARTMFGRHQRYWAGYVNGRALARHEPNVDHEPALRLEVQLCSRRHRARALGELRGYRQETGRPEPLYGHQVRP